MKEYDFNLHIGQDYGLTYVIEGGGHMTAAPLL